jgi:hypothetical protein
MLSIVLFWISVAESNQIPPVGCPHVTELFNCSTNTGLECPSDRVTCSLATTTFCSCIPGYLWLLDESGHANTSRNEICGYHQISKKEARTWQGTWILGFGAEGAGLVHIGQKHLGTIMLCLAYLPWVGVCIAACVFSAFDKLRWCAIVFGSLCVLVLIGNFVWWAMSLQQLLDGKIPDGYGCPLY